ncbi:MAG: DUF721 domain-containing protein [Acidobacteria bacterium]|nr:DUF721 domain-containing protein [Acidobacteriota bacterium]
MIPVHDVIPDALAAVLRKAPLTAEKVAFAWRMTVGPAVERATSIELRDGVLHVRAKDPFWRRELERSAAVIRRRLQALLGQDTLHALDITLP